MIEHEDRYRCEAAEADIVHARSCRLVKGVGHSPVLVEVRAVTDDSAARGWRHQARSWALSRDGWMARNMLLPDEASRLDTAQVADALSETFYPFVGAHPETAAIGGVLLDEIVQEHDTNYLIALAVAVDMLKGPAGSDRAADRIRANADADLSVRMGKTEEVGAPAHGEPGYTVLDPVRVRDAKMIEMIRESIRSERYDSVPHEIFVFPEGGRTLVADNSYGSMYVEGFASDAVAEAYAGGALTLESALESDRLAVSAVDKAMRDSLQDLAGRGELDGETLSQLNEKLGTGIDEVALTASGAVACHWADDDRAGTDRACGER